jgi:hypothetical protein
MQDPHPEGTDSSQYQLIEEQTSRICSAGLWHLLWTSVLETRHPTEILLAGGKVGEVEDAGSIAPDKAKRRAWIAASLWQPQLARPKWAERYFLWTSLLYITCGTWRELAGAEIRHMKLLERGKLCSKPPVVQNSFIDWAWQHCSDKSICSTQRWSSLIAYCGMYIRSSASALNLVGLTSVLWVGYLLVYWVGTIEKILSGNGPLD